MPGKRTPLRKAALAMELVETEGLSLREAEAKVNLDHSTIGRMIAGHHDWGIIADTPVFKRHRATQNKILEASYRAGAAIGLQEAYKPEKLEKAGHYQLVLASSIAIDKARLLAGEPTEHVAHLHYHEVNGLDKLAEKLGQTLLYREKCLKNEGETED